MVTGSKKCSIKTTTSKHNTTSPVHSCIGVFGDRFYQQLDSHSFGSSRWVTYGQKHRPRHTRHAEAGRLPKMISEAGVTEAEYSHPTRAMSEHCQNTLPYFAPDLLHGALPVAIQSSLLGAQSLGHDDGLNSS